MSSSCREKKKILSAYHAKPHCPSLQTGWFAGQEFLQDPQLLLFVFRLTHALPQGVNPGPQPTISLPCMDASWSDGTIAAGVWTTGAAVAAGGAFAESAGPVFESIHPAARARTSARRPRIRIVRIRIGSPHGRSDHILKNILIGF
jgi:hypothetical protein